MKPYESVTITMRDGKTVTCERVDGLWGIAAYEGTIPSKVDMYPVLLNTVAHLANALESVEFMCDVLATKLMDDGLYEAATNVSNVSAKAADALRSM